MVEIFVIHNWFKIKIVTRSVCINILKMKMLSFFLKKKIKIKIKN